MSLVESQLALTFDKAQDVLDVWLWRVHSLQLAKAYKECLKLRTNKVWDWVGVGCSLVSNSICILQFNVSLLDLS